MLKIHELGENIYDSKLKIFNKLRNNTKEKPNFMLDIISDFLSNTTIHGIPYLGAKDKNLIEKMWWIIGFILSVTTCTYLVTQTWHKWQENPVIVSFAQEHTSVWEIPFPAITICPISKVQESKFNYSACYLPRIFNFEVLEELCKTAEYNKTFWDVTFICDKTLIPVAISDMENEAVNTTDEGIITNIKRVSPTLKDTITNISWQNQFDRNGTIFFAERITSEGLCFTFNALGHEDMYTDQMKEGVRFIDNNMSSTGWNTEDGYSTHHDDESYPMRTSQAGLMYGLSFALHVDGKERSKFCEDIIAGFKMILHNPAEEPRIAESYVLIPTNKQIIVAVIPKVMRTSENLRGVPPHTRNCYFANEKSLRFFKEYTQYNCKIECMKNITIKHCGCVPFYLPRHSNKTEICGPLRAVCAWNATDLFFKFESLLKSSYSSIEESEKEEFEIFQQCDCLASCNYIDYAVELSVADSIHDQMYTSGSENYNKIENSTMKMFFKESQFLALERKELYGSTDFIANIGGILGLCMGFSFLSLLEIVYYLTLRIWFKMYQRYKIYSVPVSTHKPETQIAWIN